MKSKEASVLAINGGSSSIKFVLYQTGEPLERRLYGKIDRIGLPGTNLTFNDPIKNQQASRSLAASDHKSAANSLIDWLEEQDCFAAVQAVGHGVVHGMKHTEPELVTQEFLEGRVILAHLGNGASLAAVRDGKSIDTSMSFTPTAGLVMSTRSGDLDPGLAPYLARTEQITAQKFYEMVNHQSGLLGVSEISSDMRDLLAREWKTHRSPFSYTRCEQRVLGASSPSALLRRTSPRE